MVHESSDDDVRICRMLEFIDRHVSELHAREIADKYSDAGFGCIQVEEQDAQGNWQWIDVCPWDDPDHPFWVDNDEEVIQCMVDDLIEAIASHCPDDVYFGRHWDGGCIGFWIKDF